MDVKCAVEGCKEPATEACDKCSKDLRYCKTHVATQRMHPDNEVDKAQAGLAV